MAEILVDSDAIRKRVIDISVALLSLAIQNVMEKPSIQTAILIALERNVESSVLLALAEIPPTPTPTP